MNRIIIIGVSHHNTLGMIRCIGIAGYRADLVLIGESNSFVSKSKYLDNVYYLTAEEELANFLDSQYRDSNNKPLIISCTDQAASVLDKNYERLKERFILFHSSEDGLITHFMNKQVQTTLASEVGLAVPVSFEYNGDISEMIYPCLLKPVQSISGGKQVVICNNEDELKSGIDTFNEQNVILVQQFLKKEEEIVVLGLSVNDEISIPGYILKHRDFNGGTLYSSVRSIETLEVSFVEKCKELVRRMNYEGLFGIEFICCEGQYYFIEINLRNDATTYSLAVAGVNLPDLYIKAKLQGESLLDNFTVREIDSIVEYNDFKHRRQFGLSTGCWLKQYLNAKCKYYFSWKDPEPFFYAPFK